MKKSITRSHSDAKAKIKRKILFVAIAFLFTLCVNKENKENNENKPETAVVETTDSLRIVTQDPYYNQAYNEILDMLEGKRPHDFKRAVFLIEWAYLREELNYEQYCNQIARHAADLKKFIRGKGIEQYRTAGNYALFEFFTQPNFMNGGRVFTYDFEDFTGEIDLNKVFVTKLMRTQTGQCYSLPLFYKVLAEEIGAEAYLALAPMHMYIKHLDENNRWVNVELTNGSLASDAHIISSMGINAEEIRNKVYLDALDMKQSIAMLLNHLRRGYERQYEYDPEDQFIRLCCEKTLEYFPTNIQAWISLGNVYWDQADAYSKKLGLPWLSVADTFATRLHTNMKMIESKMEELGYRKLTREDNEEYLKWLESEAGAKERAEYERKNNEKNQLIK